MINVAELFRQLVEEFNHSESVALLGLAMTGLGLGLIFSARRRAPQKPPRQADVPEQPTSKRNLSTSVERR